MPPPSHPRLRPAMSHPRSSRSRVRYPLPQDPLSAKHKPVRHSALSRVVPVYALLVAAVLAFFGGGLLMARHLEPPEEIVGEPAKRNVRHVHPLPPALPVAAQAVDQARNVAHDAQGTQTGRAGAGVVHVKQEKEEEGAVVSEDKVVAENKVIAEDKVVAEDKVIPEDKVVAKDKVIAENKPAVTVREEDRVSWERSWPASEAADDTGLYALRRGLSFTNRTMLNYFHMHKTGGVTTKVELQYLINRPENRGRLTKRGERMQAVETCYELTEPTGKDDKSVEHMWRCDFYKILNMTEQERGSIDVMMGHQYWENGCDAIFGATRDLKHFSIFRHPLPRKLSFFYHFFVRNLGRDEKAVGKDEVIGFLLGDNLPADPRTRDAGPNYYASRMLSDGTKGFGEDHRYDIVADKQDEAIRIAVDRLDREFAFVGLQLQGEASQCMLMKTMQVLTHEHGLDDMLGTPKLAESTRRLNTGGYPWTARKIWDVMTQEQRQRYRQVEKVDLAIYDRVVKRFKEDVKLFSCEDKVDAGEFKEDVFE